MHLPDNPDKLAKILFYVVLIATVLFSASTYVFIFLKYPLQQ